LACSAVSINQTEVAMDSLNKNQRERLDKVLAQRETELRNDLQRELTSHDNYIQLASEVPDPGDQSFANLSVDLGNAAVTRDLQQLRAVELARKRMDSGTYGECVTCGYTIPFERLVAMPAAERCAPCQENFERTHHEGHRGATM
jgi:RNA polymerase-binding transcription factor DksA